MDIHSILRKAKIDDIINELRRRIECSLMPIRNLLIFGPPASGKSTMAKKLAEEFCLCHISYHELLRKNSVGNYSLSKQIQDSLKNNKEIPENIIFDILSKETENPECYAGFVLTHFQRKKSQISLVNQIAQNSKGVAIQKVFNLSCEEPMLFERIEGKRVHESSGRIYHIKHNPPKVQGIDDITGENLIKRAQDNGSSLKSRIFEYLKEFREVSEEYKKERIYYNIDANQSIEHTYKNIKNYF